jgi:hypothetical protein
MKPIKTIQNQFLKMLLLGNMVKSFWNLKKKAFKSIRIKAHLDTSILYPWGTKKLRKIK